ncbi:indole-3-glycerol-phosphate synthase [Gloeomargarita lithophora Alchichica-D10]|uniref:Indole-3-glycerol phosphate synthase n=1 Tax=Gloeomargarita lithophora Alchichica-D10 TaxID=1188229 RepID=A0A1J0AF63_9CYAN|nr:indole-3-glycerol phosphate synthase TrpC [Gloeomargarita lithophora]APB34560.1 indole-3-glycerol-phosphate synthase [Gloeomargarita lithophora Alchichica-D10]
MVSIRRTRPYLSPQIRRLGYQLELATQPQHILEEIVWAKETEVQGLREHLPLHELQKQVLSAPVPQDFLGALQAPPQPGLIGEVKKASPSKGIIRADFDPVAIAQSYEKAGARCISVLTDAQFFQGSWDYLSQIRQAVSLPLLCKEFIIYPYQIYLARCRGASAVLLIAAILSDQDLHYFNRIIHALGMVALVEVHTLGELARVLGMAGVNLIGINNRNLENFTTDLSTTESLLAQKFPEIQKRGIVMVSESGIHTPEDVMRVKKAGVQGILVGESLMKQADIELAVQNLLREVK